MSVCVSVCLSVWPPCVCASLRRLPPNVIHALKIFPGRFVRQCRSARHIERASSEGPVFVAAMASSTTARTGLFGQGQTCYTTASANTTMITAAQKSAAG